MKQIITVLIILFVQALTFGQVGSIDTVPVYKIIPDTLIKGIRDSNGKRQGVYYQHNDNGTINFIRTYKNDTLNGFLGCYSPKGFVNSEQFYKNGKNDSLWFDYYEGNKLKAKGFFKNGLKHGVFLKFHKNGNLKSEAFYNNDTLIGNIIEYYPNRIIRSIGNNENGKLINYNINGELENICWRVNRRIVRTLYFVSDSLKKQERVKILPKKIKKDTSIINNTNLIIEELYDNQNTIISHRGNELEPFGLISRVGFYSIDSIIYILVENDIFILRTNEVEYCFSCLDYDSKNRKDTISFGTNIKVIEKENGEIEIIYPKTDYRYKTDLGELIVHNKHLQCDDTGNNPITLINNRKKIEFKHTKNISIYEYDSNSDGINEIYIITYQSCMNTYKIYRIKMK